MLRQDKDSSTQNVPSHKIVSNTKSQAAHLTTSDPKAHRTKNPVSDCNYSQ